ncbi:unnamed protein product [Coccothraustes coccothraustes]
MCKVLILGCVAAVILMTAAYGVPLTKTQLSPAEKEACLEASITDLGLLGKIDNNFLDFYTPNDREECNHTTLACFLKELKVLIHDVEEEDKRIIINIEKNLEDFMVSNLLQVLPKKKGLKNCFTNRSYHQSIKFPVLQEPDFSNPTCKKCEANEKKKFPEFHQEMTRFLHSMRKESV